MAKINKLGRMQRVSLDGISPVGPIARRPYFVRDTSRRGEQPFISIRPQVRDAQLREQPNGRRFGTGEVEIIKTAGGKAMIIPRLRQLRVPENLRQDVVVKLPRQWSFRAGILTLVQYLILAVVAVAAGYSTGIGQWFVLAYAVYALLTRQDSRLSFGIALFVLVSVPFFQAINQPGVANNMAVYVYELLVVGTVQALLELRREGTSDTTPSSRAGLR